MDILLTLVASFLLIIGFFVICRASDDEDETDELEQTVSNESEQLTNRGGNEQ
jgi:hypothetical protein